MYTGLLEKNLNYCFAIIFLGFCLCLRILVRFLFVYSFLFFTGCFEHFLKETSISNNVDFTWTMKNNNPTYLTLLFLMEKIDVLRLLKFRLIFKVTWFKTRSICLNFFAASGFCFLKKYCIYDDIFLNIFDLLNLRSIFFP